MNAMLCHWNLRHDNMWTLTGIPRVRVTHATYRVTHASSRVTVHATSRVTHATSRVTHATSRVTHATSNNIELPVRK